MTSYRFCRPDDIPLLVRAVEECWRVHFPDEPTLTVEGFRREMKEVDVWPSNSMVALGGAGGDEPVAVMIGTKREREVLVHRLGVKPGHERQGHGSHLVTSLSQKLAVLGPERLVAEVPESLPVARALLESIGWQVEERLVDWVREPGTSAGVAIPRDLVIPVGVGDLEAAGVLETPGDAPWHRTAETLRQSSDAVSGSAIATPDALLAWLLWRSAETGTTEILALGAVADGGTDPLVLTGLLLDSLSEHGEGRLVVRRVGPREPLGRSLAACGFTPGAATLRLTATARPL